LAGFHASRESLPLPPTWDKEKAVGGASRDARDSSLFDDGFHASRDSVPLPPSSDREKAIGGASTPLPANCVAYEFPKADALGKPIKIQTQLPLWTKDAIFPANPMVYFIKMQFFYVSFVLRNRA
jgi:hypothetical protein